MRTVDIFIVTFLRDLEFYRCCLRSVRKFATGWNHVHTLVPMTDVGMFNGVAAAELPPDKITVTGFNEVAGKGMCHHMSMVCQADRFSDADYILHIDSDCIFKSPVNVLDEYFFSGLPILCYAPFDTLPDDVRVWQGVVEKALGWKPFAETMRRHPAVHPRWVYQKVRKAIVAHTKMDFHEYVLSCRNEFPQGFAEFPTLGAWALQNAPEAYHWIDTSKQTLPAKIAQFWSHGGLSYKWLNGEWTGKTSGEVIEEILK